MSLVSEEILDQPRAWAEAIRLARETAALPAGERVAVIGCGSSWHAAKVIASLRELVGDGPTDSFAASEALLARGYDRVVAISRSGTTTEIRRALETVSGSTSTVAIVGDPASPVAEACDDVIDLSFADDLAVVQTRFVSTVICFARECLSGAAPVGLLAASEQALAADHPVDPAGVERVVVLGRSWCSGLADAGALTLRETALMWAESYPSMEYRHGPIATAGPGAVVWILDEPPAGLAAEIEATGATTAVGAMDPLAELIRIQRFAVALAELKGLDPDHPQNLERAVVLDLAESAGS